MANNSVTQIFVGGKQKPVGFVKRDCFYKNFRASVHMLRKPPAIAFDVESLDMAEQAGAVRVQVTDTETGTMYRANLAHIRENGFPFNRGFGEQVALPLSGWTVTRKGEIPARQLGLWQGVNA